MLPSVTPLTHPGSSIPVQRQSIGDHLTARTVDTQAAEAYQKVRSNLYKRSEYWRGNIE